MTNPLTKFALIIVLITLSGITTHSYAASTELDKVIALVNDDVITQSQINQRMHLVKEQLSHGHTPLPSDKKLRQQILNQLISESIQLQLAKRHNITVSDEELNTAIRNLAQKNKMSLLQFKHSLQYDNVNYSQFRDEIKNEMILRKLQRRKIQPQIKVSEEEVNAFFKGFKSQQYKNQQYHLQNILIALPDVPSPEQVEAARDTAHSIVVQLQHGANFEEMAIANSTGPHALTGGDLGWRSRAMLPDVFAAKVKHMHPGQVSHPIRTANGFHILKLVAVRGSEGQHIITQSHVRHILLQTNAVTNNQQVIQKLKNIRQTIKKGNASFAQLAQKYSQDKTSAVKGGDLGWTNPGDVVPGFANAMNKLAIMQISQPVHSKFGWHVIQVLERRSKNMTQAFQKNKVRQQIMNRKFDEALASWIQQLRSTAYIKKLADPTA